MSQLFKYFTLLVLAAWAIGAFMLHLDPTIHIYLLIGMYALALYVGAEYKRRQKRQSAPVLLLTQNAENRENTLTIAESSPVQDTVYEIVTDEPMVMEIPVSQVMINDVADDEAIPQPTKKAARWWSHIKVAYHLQLPDSIQLQAKVAMKHAQGADFQAFYTPHLVSEKAWQHTSIHNNWYWVTNHPSNRLVSSLKSGQLARNPIFFASCMKKMENNDPQVQDLTLPIFMPIFA